MTPKQRAFVEQYLIDLNATAAAVRAGYSERTAKSLGSELLAHPAVSAAIAAAQAERSARVGVTVDAVLNELALHAFYDPLDYAHIKSPEDLATLPPGARRAVAGWTWTKEGKFVIKLAGKTQTLELLGRHLGMWSKGDDNDAAAQLASALERARQRVLSDGASQARH